MKNTLLLKYLIISLISIVYMSILCPISISANESFKNIGIQNGLAHTDANCVAQDSTGLIWIGTNSGLQNFDGYQLQTIDYYPSNQKIYESHNRITALECSKNRLWVGSDSGLTCLDLNTHLYVPYTIAEGDPTIFNQRILRLSIDNANHHLWIRVENQLYVAKIEEATNTLYLLEWDNNSNLSTYWTQQKPVIYEGKAWITTDKALIQLAIINQKVHIKRRYQLEDLLRQKTEISSLYASEGYLYLRSSQGCFRLPFSDNDLNTSDLSYIDFHQTNPNIPNNTIDTFIVGKDGTLWCGYFGGIFEVRQPFTEHRTINQYLENNRNINFSRTRISSLFIDKFNNLWISTIDRGLYYRSLSSTPFNYLSNSKFQEIGFAKNEISSVTAQDNKTLWMIIAGGSVFYYNFTDKKLRPISLPITRGAADGLQTISLSNDQQRLYIGLVEGLIVYEIKTGKSYWLIGKQSKVLPHSISISRIKEDKWGRIWASSWGAGAYCISNPESSPSVTYYLGPHSQYSIISNLVTDLYIEDQALLLCTTNGLNKIWLDDNGAIRKISLYQANENIPRSMSSNYIACIDQQNDSVYWIGTIGGGVNKLTIHSQQNNDYSATCYTNNDGLTSNDSEIIYIDKKQNIWIGGKGITCIQAKTNRIYVYSSDDDLQNNSFKIGAGCKASDGTIYMGGTNGLCYFQPDNLEPLHSSTGTISLIFRDLYINNEQVIAQAKYDGQTTLPEIFNLTPHINLTYKQNNFIISFAALGHTLADQIVYRYRMTNYEKEWQMIPHSINKAYYSNLPYGNYKFELQVSTDRGFTWITPGREISFSISPPWWLTGWAKLLYVLIFLSISTIIVYQYHKEQKLKRENHIKELERINDEERYQSKMRFFMNVSHELKTPLTLIMLSAEKLMETGISQSVSAIWNNSKKMLALIAELIDIRKADLGINKLLLTHQNIAALVAQLFSEIKPWAEKKEIEIQYISEEDNLKMDFDWDKIGKLIINLLSNAIKYTPQKGSISIILKKAAFKDIEPLYQTRYQEGEIQTDEPVCVLIVRDTGVGISPESIRHIYERFFQVSNKTQAHLGTGIGLAIAKTMVLLHKGAIIVSSERMTGTEFIVALPINNLNISSESEQAPSSFDAKEFIDNQYLEYIPMDDNQPTSIREHSSNSSLPLLLIVEDNIEMQNALEERLRPYYQIHIANNGKEGLEKCKSLFPDIIISDVMMPEMDGIEMCKHIRNDLSIAYIPIILLTAKGNVEHQIEGYESGADLYIPKPFSIKLLTVNLKRLLKQKERYLKEELKITKETAGNIDSNEKHHKDLWETELHQLIKDNISNTDLSVDFICERLFISRSSLYNKMREYNHQPLADYIRNVRLTMAAELLLDPSYTINEVVMDVGMVNTSHFSKVFKTKYGMSPSEYKNKNASTKNRI